MGKYKYKEFGKLGENIQYFGDGNIKKGEIIEITHRPPLRFLFKEVTEPLYFWGGEYKYLRDSDGNEIGNDLDSKVVILNKSYVSVSKRISMEGKHQVPAEKPTRITLDKLLCLRKASDYSKMPSETL